MTAAATDTGSRKVYFAVTGNCQAMFVASALKTLPGVEVGCFGKEVRYLPVEGKSAETYKWESTIPVIEQKKADGCHVVLCEQTWYRNPYPDISRAFDLADGIVRFPFIHNYGLWPHGHLVERAGKVKAGVRMLRADQDVIRQNDAMSDVKMLDFFNERFKDEILYDTPLHPSPLMLTELMRRIVATPAIAELGYDTGPLIDSVARSRGINTVFEHPVDPELAEAVGVNWATKPSYLAYRACRRAMEDDRQLAWRLLAEFLAMDDGDEAFFRRMVKPFVTWNLANLHGREGDMATANALREQVMALDPLNTIWHRRYARELADRGYPAEAYEIMKTAIKIMPRDPQVHISFADFALLVDDVPGALAALEVALRWMSEGKRRVPLEAQIAELRRRLGLPTDALSAEGERMLALSA